MPFTKSASLPVPKLVPGTGRLLAGWLALLVYLGTGSPLGLGVAALLGSLDPNHQLQVGSSEQGLQLVLHHNVNCCAHHHGAVARMLTLFAQQASATDPDHVLQFSAAESYRHGAQLAAPSPTALAQPVFTPIEATFCSPHGPQPSSVPPHPPPDEGGRLVRLRSIQLLV